MHDVAREPRSIATIRTRLTTNIRQYNTEANESQQCKPFSNHTSLTSATKRYAEKNSRPTT